jgi:hypothetical protein
MSAAVSVINRQSMAPPLPLDVPRAVLAPAAPPRPPTQKPIEIVKLSEVERETSTSILETACEMLDPSGIDPRHVARMVESPKEGMADRIFRLNREGQIGNYAVESASIILECGGFGSFVGRVRSASAQGSRWVVILVISTPSQSNDYMTGGTSQPMFGNGLWQLDFAFAADRRVYDAVETITAISNVSWAEIEMRNRMLGIWNAGTGAER